MFDFIRSFQSRRNLRRYMHMLEALGDRELTATDIVSLQEPLRSVLNAAIRAGRVQTAALATDLALRKQEASSLAVLLVKRGIFRVVDATTYDVRVSGKTYSHENSRTMELWAKLDKKDLQGKDDDKK